MCEGAVACIPHVYSGRVFSVLLMCVCVGECCLSSSSLMLGNEIYVHSHPAIDVISNPLVAPCLGMSSLFWACCAPLAKTQCSSLTGSLLSCLHTGVTEVLVTWEEDASSGSFLNLSGHMVNSEHTLNITPQSEIALCESGFQQETVVVDYGAMGDSQ